MLAVCVRQLKHYVPLGCCIEPSPSVSPSCFVSLHVHRRLLPCWPPNSRLSGEGGIDRGEQAQSLLGLLPVASGSCFQPGCGSLPLPCKEVPLTSISCSITCLTSFLLNSLHYKDSELLLCFWPMTIGLFLCHPINICRWPSSFQIHRTGWVGVPPPPQTPWPSRHSVVLPGPSPRTPLLFTTPVTFSTIPSTYCHLIFIYFCYFSKTIPSRHKLCLYISFLPQSYHRHLNTISEVNTVEKVSAVCVLIAGMLVTATQRALKR